jgi:hypothetical protein
MPKWQTIWSLIFPFKEISPVSKTANFDAVLSGTREFALLFKHEGKSNNLQALPTPVIRGPEKRHREMLFLALELFPK